MTREELKRHCQRQVEICEKWARHNGEEPQGKIYEEHKLILELLEREPCEDAISRQAVEKITWEEPSYTDVLNALTEVREKVRALPSITPHYTDAEIQKMQELEQAEIQKAYELGKAEQPKTGHWIYTLEDWNKWECSECGFTKRTDVHVSIGYKFCPKCGTKMESKEEL